MKSWIFPAIKDKVGFEKVEEEFMEFKDAAENYKSDEQDKIKRMHTIEEGMDLVHAVETYLRNIGVGYEEREDIVSYIYMKNKLRGYYD